MRRFLASVGVSGLLFTGGIAAAPAASALDSHTLKFRGIQTSSAEQGRSFSFRERLERGENEVVGSAKVECRFDAAFTRARCIGVFSFPGQGSLFARGVLTFDSSRFDVPIVAGTGGFTNARGTLHVTDRGDRGESYVAEFRT